MPYGEALGHRPFCVYETTPVRRDYQPEKERHETLI